MRLLNTLTTALGQLLLSPFASFPILGLLFWGAVLGIGFTFLFGKVSSQRRLRELSAQAKAQLLAIKLFRHDPLITLRCQGQLLKFAGLRLWYSLPAMLVMLIPSVLILVQMAQWYEYEPLPLGRSAVVDLRIAADQWNANQDVVIEVPSGIALETDSLRDATHHVISWRIPARGVRAQYAALAARLDETREAVVGRRGRWVIDGSRRPTPRRQLVGSALASGGATLPRGWACAVGSSPSPTAADNDSGMESTVVGDRDCRINGRSTHQRPTAEGGLLSRAASKLTAR